ncbi:hypothetical protein AMJ44_00055 [candidate division WOR-1 bacterium DG_54_3]|uniref:Uncharacterized protein n=1 Tax=candidate division WOR-1 bacterium DG_54_3 TaxID=1703775 RepID=A0A0S7Y700_UNCSA|nr:MAG: hypothetical protein AMJ44_00055 [candidate division WOR-1 bacterium DG_54_3]
MFFTNLDPKLKDNNPPTIMTIRKQRISLVLKDKGRSFMSRVEENFFFKINYTINKKISST